MKKIPHPQQVFSRYCYIAFTRLLHNHEPPELSTFSVTH